VSFGQKVGKFSEYLVTRFFTGCFGLMPFRLRVFATETLGTMLYYLLKRQRNLVYANLKHAFPNRSDEWYEKTAKKSFKNTGRMIAEFTALPRLKGRFYDRWVRHLPSAEFHRSMYDQGVIMIMGHLGSWEWHGVVGPHLIGRNVYPLAKRQSNPWSNKYIENMRAKGGMTIIYTDEPAKRIFKMLKDGKLVAFIADQNAGGDGIHVPFMNRLASTFIGPAVFARATTVPVFFAWSWRDEKGRLCFEGREVPRPKLDKKKQAQDWQNAFTLAWVRILELGIKDHPADYFWVHNRWKTPLPEGTTEEEVTRYWKKLEKLLPKDLQSQ